jgi:hypothetical protein
VDDAAITVQETEHMAETMTAEQATKLIEAGIAKANAPLLERLRKADATDEARKILEGVTLPDKAKTRIVERVVANIPLKDGELDIAKLRESVVSEAKSEGEYLASITGSGRVIGMGPTVVTEADEKVARKAEKKKLKEAKRLREGGRDAFEALGMPKDAAKLASREVA